MARSKWADVRPARACIKRASAPFSRVATTQERAGMKISDHLLQWSLLQRLIRLASLIGVGYSERMKSCSRGIQLFLKEAQEHQFWEI